MKRKIVIEAETDSSGEYCRVLCRFSVGFYCDAFKKPLKRVEGTLGKVYRCTECKEAECD